jgi:hypothetical protein
MYQVGYLAVSRSADTDQWMDGRKHREVMDAEIDISDVIQ